MFGASLPLRFWWTESPLKSPQKSARASRPTQKSALESKCTLLSPQKRAPIFGLAPKRAQEIAQKSKTLKKKRSKELVSQISAQESVSFKRGGRSKEFATHKSELLKKVLKQVPLYKMFNATNYALKF